MQTPAEFSNFKHEREVRMQEKQELFRQQMAAQSRVMLSRSNLDRKALTLNRLPRRQSRTHHPVTRVSRICNSKFAMLRQGTQTEQVRISHLPFHIHQSLRDLGKIARYHQQMVFSPMERRIVQHLVAYVAVEFLQRPCKLQSTGRHGCPLTCEY
jgi:hypothetical protein